MLPARCPAPLARGSADCRQAVELAKKRSSSADGSRGEEAPGAAAARSGPNSSSSRVKPASSARADRRRRRGTATATAAAITGTTKDAAGKAGRPALAAGAAAAGVVGGVALKARMQPKKALGARVPKSRVRPGCEDDRQVGRAGEQAVRQDDQERLQGPRSRGRSGRAPRQDPRLGGGDAAYDPRPAADAADGALALTKNAGEAARLDRPPHSRAGAGGRRGRGGHRRRAGARHAARLAARAAAAAAGAPPEPDARTRRGRETPRGARRTRPRTPPPTSARSASSSSRPTGARRSRSCSTG